MFNILQIRAGTETCPYINLARAQSDKEINSCHPAKMLAA